MGPAPKAVRHRRVARNGIIHVPCIRLRTVVYAYRHPAQRYYKRITGCVVYRCGSVNARIGRRQNTVAGGILSVVSPTRVWDGAEQIDRCSAGTREYWPVPTVGGTNPTTLCSPGTFGAVTPPDELTIRWDETAERTVGVGDLARTRPELVAHHRRDKAKKETRERAERETARAKAETERVDDVWRQLGELWEKDLADHEKRWEEWEKARKERGQLTQRRQQLGAGGEPRQGPSEYRPDSQAAAYGSTGRGTPGGPQPSGRRLQALEHDTGGEQQGSDERDAGVESVKGMDEGPDPVRQTQQVTKKWGDTRYPGDALEALEDRQEREKETRQRGRSGPSIGW